MKVLILNTGLLPLAVFICLVGPLNVVSSGNAKSRNPHSIGYARKPRFVSFNNENEKIRIDLELSVPFLSIPLKNEQSNNISPLVNVNTKALTIVGLLTAFTALIVPLIVKSHSTTINNRSDRHLEWQQLLESTINDVIFGNNYITPCMLHAICSAISEANRTRNPTSTENLINDIFSHRWFKQVTNGTAIQEAIAAGKEEERDCSVAYPECLVTTTFLGNIIKQFGIL